MAKYSTRTYAKGNYEANIVNTVTDEIVKTITMEEKKTFTVPAQLKEIMKQLDITDKAEARKYYIDTPTCEFTETYRVPEELIDEVFKTHGELIAVNGKFIKKDGDNNENNFRKS